MVNACVRECILYIPNLIAKDTRLDLTWRVCVCFSIRVQTLITLFIDYNKAHNISNQNRSTTSCRHWLHPTIVALHLVMFTCCYASNLFSWAEPLKLFTSAVVLSSIENGACELRAGSMSEFAHLLARSFAHSQLIHRHFRNKQHINIMNCKATAKMGRWVHFIQRKTRSQLIGHKTLVISSSLELWEIVFAPIELLLLPLLPLLLDNHCCQRWQHGYISRFWKTCICLRWRAFQDKIWIETIGSLHKNIFEPFFIQVLCYQNENGSTFINQYVFSCVVFLPFFLENTLAMCLLWDFKPFLSIRSRHCLPFMILIEK